MKKILLVICGLAVFYVVHAQNYNNIVNYSLNGTPVNGVKIKTNLTFSNGSQMPTIHIYGYTYGSKDVVDLTLVYYIYNGTFINYSMSSAGSYMPTIQLSDENGKVVIFMTDKPYFQRFTVSVYAKGMPYDDNSAYFQGWTVVDEALTGTNTVTVPYKNKLSGDVSLSNGVWNTAGNVGIGTTSPAARLNIYTAAADSSISALKFGIPNDKGNIQVPINSPTGGYNIDFATWRDMVPDQIGARIRAERLNRYQANNGLIQGMDLVFFTSPAGSQSQLSERLRIDYNGNVGIGTSNPTEKLSVKGNIKAQEVKVTTAAADWPDYVFKPDYKLSSLNDLAKQIKQSGHLPDIPSAKDIEKNGQALGEMNKKLLQKVEELTLYIIEQNKRLDAQEKRINVLERQINN